MPPARRKARTTRNLSIDRSLLDALEQAVIATDRSGRVIFMNRFAERQFGWRSREALGRSVLEIAPSDLDPETALERIASLGARGYASERMLRRRDGSTFPAAVTVAPILDGRGRTVGAIGLSRDISSSRESERRREAQYAVTRALAESATLAEAVPAVLGAVGTGLHWELGILWMVDWNAELLRCVEVWTSSPGRHRLFEELSRRMVFPRGVELCGQVWAANASVWTQELERLLSPPRALVAGSEGFNTAVGFPVRAARGVIGAVTFYGYGIPEPDADLRAMLTAIGSQIGLFTERREADRLESSLSQMRALSRRLVAVREEERARASREFHDQLGQSLTGLKLDIAWVGRQVAALDPRPAHVEEKIRDMSAQVDAAIHTVREVITELRPRVLDELGLLAAVEWQCSDFRRRSGIACELRADLPDLDLDESRRTAVFRVLQEILTNVARHAGASRTDVILRVEPGELVLQVRDNGRGITETDLTARSSLGLLGMRERVQSCDGTIEFHSAPKGGTTVTMRIPLDRQGNV